MSGPAEQKPRDESVTASATRDAVPRVGVVISSFTGGEEHDGTKITGLADPRPLDAELTYEQLRALVLKAIELGQLTRSRRRRSLEFDPAQNWVVVLVRGQDGPPGSGTDPRVVRAVMETLVQTGGGKRYTIARGSATKLNGFSDDWHKLVADMKQRASQARFELLDLNEDECLESPTLDRHCASRNPKGLYTLARTIRECDRLISVAPLATDPATGVALTLGNFWGIAPGSAYGYPKTKLLELGAPAEILCDLYLHQPSSFTVVGGSMAVEGEGDKPLRHNVVIAGRITTAVDAVAAAVMGFDPRKLPHLGLFEKRGFGIRDTDSIWTSGCELDAATRRFRRPSRWEES